MMKNKKRICIIALCFVLVLSCCACESSTSDEKKIANTLDNFITACKDVDLEEMMDCFDPSYTKVINALGGLMDYLAGEDYYEYILSAFSTFGYNITADSRDIIDSIELDIQGIDVDKNGTSAVARCVFSCEVNGKNESEVMDVYMVKKNDEWYISEGIY